MLAALAQSGPELIGSRVLQGIAGAMMLPTSLSLLNAGFRGRDRAIAFAVWGSTIGGTAALGPLLGGWLTTSYSWRWAFGINIPLGIAVVAGTLLLVPESREMSSARGNDLVGALLSVLGFGGIIFGLIQGRSYGWWARTGPVSIAGFGWRWPLSPIPVAFAAGVICLVAFAVVELRRNAAGRVVLLDLRLFAIPSFRNGNIAAAIVSLGEFGLLFALPLWFENVRGYSAFRTGIALLPLAIGSFAASGFGAQLARQRGPVFAVRLGIVLEIAGVAGIGVVAGPATAWWATVPVLFVYGLGVGLATAQLTGVVLADVPVANSGQASGTQSTSRQIGSAFGIAILGTVLFTALGAQLSQRLSGIPAMPAGQRSALVAAVKQSAGAVIGQLAASPRTAAAAAMAKAGVLPGDPPDRVHRCRLPRPRAARQPLPRPRKHLTSAGACGRRSSPADRASRAGPRVTVLGRKRNATAASRAAAQGAPRQPSCLLRRSASGPATWTSTSSCWSAADDHGTARPPAAAGRPGIPSGR